MDVKEDCKDANWVQMAQYRMQWQDLNDNDNEILSSIKVVECSDQLTACLLVLLKRLASMR